MTLSEYRSRHSLSRAAFGRLVGVTPSTALRWEDGSIFPSPAALAKISEVTGAQVTANDFVAARTAATAPAVAK